MFPEESLEKVDCCHIEETANLIPVDKEGSGCKFPVTNTTVLDQHPTPHHKLEGAQAPKHATFYVFLPTWPNTS